MSADKKHMWINENKKYTKKREKLRNGGMQEQKYKKISAVEIFCERNTIY